jgi:hypothetical protein
MSAESGLPSDDERIEKLDRVVVPVGVRGETALAALEVFAFRPSTPTGACWSARRQDPDGTIILNLVAGPLSGMVLRFELLEDRPAGAYSSMLSVTGEYGAQLAGPKDMLERFGAKQAALLLRDEAVDMLKALVKPGTTLERELRAADRHSVTCLARLYVADREWNAELLNASASGSALLLVTSPGMQDDDREFLLHASTGEIDVLLQQDFSRAPVEIRYVVPDAGGLRVGLRITDLSVTDSLLRRALAQESAVTPELPDLPDFT